MTRAPGGLWFGGDYNPEQWDEKVWAQDGALMREARVNTATVGVFAWSSSSRRRDGMSSAGWTTRSTGWTISIAAELARRYASHPALALWHVHNEYGTVCWCDHAAASFRDWLRRRYSDGGDGLIALNEAWGTAFWSQRYSAWEQVLPPRATQWLANPSQTLDYHRFWSDELLAAYTEQRDVIREHAPSVPVTTNFILPDYQVLDAWAWSREVDVVAVDHYLGSPGPDGHCDIAFCGDRARSWAAAGRGS